MKLIGLVLATVFCFGAHAEKKEYLPVTIDWSAQTLSDSVVLHCDDAFYSGITLTLPGEINYPGWHISYEDCAVDWKLMSNDMVTDAKTQKKYTVLRFNGGSRCTMKIKQQVKPPTTPKYFTLDISDAC